MEGQQATIFLEGHTWLEALYMTVITLSTVGFREVRPLSPTGQIFTVGLVISGVGVVFYTMAALAETEPLKEIERRVSGAVALPKQTGA